MPAFLTFPETLQVQKMEYLWVVRMREEERLTEQVIDWTRYRKCRIATLTRREVPDCPYCHLYLHVQD